MKKIKEIVDVGKKLKRLLVKEQKKSKKLILDISCPVCKTQIKYTLGYVIKGNETIINTAQVERYITARID